MKANQAAPGWPVNLDIYFYLLCVLNLFLNLFRWSLIRLNGFVFVKPLLSELSYFFENE